MLKFNKEWKRKMENIINKILVGDCLVLFKLVKDNSIDLIVTSPPYNLGIDYGVYKDNLKWDDYLCWCKKWLIECLRVLKDDGKICLNHYLAFRDLEKVDRFPIMDLRNIMEEIGFKFGKLIIWEDKSYAKFTAWGSWMSASDPYIQTPYEGILIGYKKSWKKQSRGKTTITKEEFIEAVSGVWKCGTEVQPLTKCCFPVKLPELCIKLLTYEGDLVLDPFIGSGTTAIACLKTNRRFIGFEISEEYVKIANERIKKWKEENRDLFNESG